MKKIITPVLVLTLLAGGCANPNMAQYQDSKLPVYPEVSSPVKAPGATEPKAIQDSYRETDSGKRYSLTLKDADLRDVLTLLSRDSNVPIVSDRDIEGRVTINLTNKKLGEILYTVLKPLDLTARVENGVIIVSRPAMITRSYQINYLKDKRDTTSNTSSGSGVRITANGSSDFWPAIESALEVLIFGTSGKGSRNGSGYIRGDIETREVSEKEGGVSVQAKGKGNVTSEKHNGENTDNKTATASGSGSINLSGSGRAQAVSYHRQDIKTKRQLIVNELAGIIQVTDYSDNIDKISSFLADIEPAIKRQVMIQAHIIEVSLSDGFSLGLNWRAIADKATSFSITQALVPVNALTGTAANPVPVPVNQNAFNIAGGNGDFSLLLDAMKDQGQIKILSSPKISALNNQKAVIKLTTQEVSWDFKTKDTSIGNTTNTNSGYESKVIEVGIFLDVTPQISEDGTITMQVHPSISEVKSVSVSPDSKSTMPIIDTREIDTTAIAKSGDTIVIAGLIVDKLRETKRSIPLLGDIPYAGALFSNSSMIRAKTELVIMLTPYVLNAKSIEEIKAEHERRLQNISGDFHLINNLGSLVTEKRSRDWMNSMPTLPAAKPVEPVSPKPAVQGSVSVTTPLPKVAPQDQPVAPAVKPAEKKSELNEQIPAPKSAKQTPPRPVIPAEEKAEVRSAEASVAKQSEAAAGTVAEAGATKQTPPRIQKSSKPTLEAITRNNDNIRLVLSNMKTEPKVLRESKNRRIIIKLPGVQSSMGSPNLLLNTLGFDRAKVARHRDGIWVVLHSSEQRLPNVETHVNAEGLTVTSAPVPVAEPVAAVVPIKKAARKKRVEVVSSEPSHASQPVTMATLEQPAADVTPAVSSPAAEKEKPASRQQVAVTTTTTSSEQALYRIGVAAYKSGNCSEAIKQLSSFIASYPDSAFAGDAAVYRGDCLEKSR